MQQPAGVETLNSLVATINDFQRAIATLEKAITHHAAGSAVAHAAHMRDQVLTSMNELRNHGDKLETLVADDLWPLPTYREMLFIK